MASQQELYQLVGRAMVDDDFRSKLLQEPAAAAESAGTTLTSAQVSRIKALDAAELEKLADKFKDIITVASFRIW